MGDVVMLNPPGAGPRPTIAPEPSGDIIVHRWHERHLSEAAASLATAALDVGESLKLMLQGQHPTRLVTDETVESAVLALIPIIHLNGMAEADRALYAAAVHWLHIHQGDDHAD